MKAIRSNRKITPFGGVVPVLKQIRDFKIPQLIRQSLGERPKQARYGYDDVIISWMITNLCGGMRLDHITKLRKNLSVIPNLKLCSHDTLGRVMKSLATEVLTEQSVERGKRRSADIRRTGIKTYKRITTRKTNQHEPFNKLLIKLACRVGVLNPKVKYDLDLDATTIATRVLEANKNYKQFMGFSPMVGSIDNMPVFIEMRNGNVSPNARVKECAEACINNLKENNITIGRLRMDKGGFNLSTFELLDRENIKFCVGTPKYKSLMTTAKERDDWKSVKIETALYSWDCETVDIMHTMTKSNTVYRVVALRVDRTLREKPKTPSGWTYGGKYAYKMIITNDFESSAKELYEFYHQRGTSEQTFTEVKQQFAWKYPPFSFMAENTVYLMVTSMTAILYQGLIRKFKKHVKQIRLNARLKDFIFTFMTVACEIVDDTAVFYDTDIPYEKIC